MNMTAVSNKFPLMLFLLKITSLSKLLLLGNLNAIVLDYIARQKIGGTTLNYFLLKQFPVLPSNAYSQDDLEFIVPRVLELTYTAVDPIPFVEDLWDSVDAKMRQLFLKQRYGEKSEDFEVFVRYDSANLPKGAKLHEVLLFFIFDPEKRALRRAALDARYARLYCLTRDDLRYILDPADLMGEDYPSETFRVLKEKEMAEFGEYRTRRLVLEAWDGEL